jgi:hypothetical protein
MLGFFICFGVPGKGQSVAGLTSVQSVTAYSDLTKMYLFLHQ